MDFFIKKWYYHFGFFWNNLTKKPVFTKKLFWVLVIGFLNLVSVDAKERSKVARFRSLNRAMFCHPSKTWLSLLTLPQASSCDPNQSYNLRSTFTKNVWKSGFFRQHLITSIKREILNVRNAHQVLVSGSSPWETWKIYFDIQGISLQSV